jgi:serine/threonine protein kinase
MTNSRYRILGEVGQGQFGQVFCGSDRTTGQLVAMKKLEHLRFPTHKFLKELAVLARLQHPNIVGLHGLEYSATGRYLVLDYCQGGTLRHLMESKVELALAQKLQIVRDVLLGLEHIHQHRIIHCDLKPENILLNVVSQGWTAQIADFGIAHFIEPTEKQNHSSGDTGSPAYMAPERFYGKYSPESDLYAVGVLLFEMVVGRRPFSGMPIDVMKAHLNQPLRIPKSIPSILRLIISKALQKLPQNRYGSATSMRMMLETVIANLNYSGPLSEPFSNSELLEDEGTELVKDNSSHPSRPRVREIALEPDHLHRCEDLEGSVGGLWLRSQGCFVATFTDREICISVFQFQNQSQNQSQERLKHIGTFPAQLTESSSIEPTLDLDPEGKRFAILQNNDEIAQSETAASDKRIDPCVGSALSIFNLTPTRQLYHRPLETQADQLWFASPRHILVSRRIDSEPDQPRSTELQLWNRRGHLYWSYILTTRLRQAVQISRDRIFALTDEAEPMGLWIDLCPFKIRQVPLDIQADWVSATRWGYVMVSRNGAMAYLNRRGRTMAKATLSIEDGVQVSAISTDSQSNLLWIATQQGNRSGLHTLDMSRNLPKALLRL